MSFESNKRFPYNSIWTIFAKNVFSLLFIDFKGSWFFAYVVARYNIGRTQKRSVVLPLTCSRFELHHLTGAYRTPTPTTWRTPPTCITVWKVFIFSWLKCELIFVLIPHFRFWMECYLMWLRQAEIKYKKYYFDELIIAFNEIVLESNPYPISSSFFAQFIIKVKKTCLTKFKCSNFIEISPRHPSKARRIDWCQIFNQLVRLRSEVIKGILNDQHH